MFKPQVFNKLKCLEYVLRRRNSSKHLILGIETSCDDTGCAIVDDKGCILGEALHSQQQVHINNGGIIPPIAQDLHRANIENVVQTALRNANITIDDVDAVATTVKPGLPLSLEIGMKYSKYLCRKHDKPLIPIHHMQAHALTARMVRDVEFPFLVLLVSGGHCLVGVVRSVNDFLLLGETLNDAPGEALDKIARRMKLKNLQEYSKISGGQAIELAASKCDDPMRFQLSVPLQQRRDCNFSFAGSKTQVINYILKGEKDYDIPPDGVIPHYTDLCAGFLLLITRHLCHRVQRVMEFAEKKGLITNNKTLVVSGGVACNKFIPKGLQIVCDEKDYKLVIPPKKLCTDNGVMIAWNGMEKWQINDGITKDYDSVIIEKSSPLGVSLVEEVANEALSCKWVKLSKLTKPEAFR